MLECPLQSQIISVLLIVPNLSAGWLSILCRSNKFLDDPDKVFKKGNYNSCILSSVQNCSFLPNSSINQGTFLVIPVVFVPNQILVKWRHNNVKKFTEGSNLALEMTLYWSRKTSSIYLLVFWHNSNTDWRGPSCLACQCWFLCSYYRNLKGWRISIWLLTTNRRKMIDHRVFSWGTQSLSTLM